MNPPLRPVLCLLLALAGALSAAPPNLVLIISDDQCYRDLGFMGNGRVHTPNLDRLASRSLRWENGYLPTSVCRPSLVTLLTGLYPHQHLVHFNHGPPGNSAYNRMESAEEYRRVREREFSLIRKVETLPRQLRDAAGYRCLQTGKFWEGHWRNAGFTEGMTTFEAPVGQGFGGLRTLASGEQVAHGNGDHGLAIGREGLGPIRDFIEDCETSDPDQPWFVWYAPYLPHEPHDSPERFRELARSRPGVREHELPYFASIAQFDATVGELVGHIEEQGLAEETLFLFVIDNGWSPDPRPNRRGAFPHTAESKRAPFDEGVRSPILLRWDGVIEPGPREELVSSIDIVPTLLGVVGIAELARDLPGIDLLGPALPERAVFGEIYPGDARALRDPAGDLAYRFVRQGALKLLTVHRQEGEANPWGGYLASDALFDVEADPREQTNLIDRPEYREEVIRLRALLDRWWDPATR